MVYRRKQDPVSEQDNKAQRPARRQERADSVIFSVCFCICKLACIFLCMLTGQLRTCRTLWPRYIDPDTLLYTVAVARSALLRQESTH